MLLDLTFVQLVGHMVNLLELEALVDLVVCKLAERVSLGVDSNQDTDWNSL